MAKLGKSTSKERQAKRKADFKRGYVKGYESALESVNLKRFSNLTGYNRGISDSKKVAKIQSKYKKYKNEI